MSTKAKTEYVILANDTRLESDEQSDILANLMQERFGVKGAKIVKNDFSKPKKDQRVNPTLDDVSGKTIIGSLVPSYLGMAAKEVIEVNTSPFFKAPSRFIAQFSDDERKDLLSYPKSYKVVATDVSQHEPEVAGETM